MENKAIILYEINKPVYKYVYSQAKSFYSNLTIKNNTWGCILLGFNNSEKQDIISFDGFVYTHKQIETRNGAVFMRMKKRILKIKDGY